MGLIYRTNSWKGSGKQSSYHNEYFDDGDVVRKVKVHLFKIFDGYESSWSATSGRWSAGGATTRGCRAGCGSCWGRGSGCHRALGLGVNHPRITVS